ncbi:DoxX family protein [Pacificimonas flava]|uniref:Integral membrane protein n=1 Tax=Pacificimonas flava TaxID=1234595 RepID=M2SGV7_9SPHN|nr:integral membrane protein [Pacificimonas flava]MBB5279521.1 putative oxidoreductase [Pacificimonas flava]
MTRMVPVLRKKAIDASDRLKEVLASPLPEGLALLLVRIALAGIFWRSGRTKVVEGSALSISDSTYFLFEYEYAGVPVPPDLAARLATYAEHAFPLLLVIGLATRLSAFALLCMTLVIQVFVYPEAWWSTHILWVALAAILISRGSGVISVDAVLRRRGGN